MVSFSGFPDHQHDHVACIDGALDVADRLCRDRGARLTDLRREVLAQVWRSHQPVGAYEILARLTPTGGRAPAPPTIYRALEFLLHQGFIHRIETRNAFIGCARPEAPHAVEILVCTDCGRAAEVPDDRPLRAIKQAAADIGFAVESQTIELAGRCAECREQVDYLHARA
jgi:Fur family zinc uptake transcriptional regulator